MSYSEDYIKLKLLKELDAVHVVSTCELLPSFHSYLSLSSNYCVRTLITKLFKAMASKKSTTFTVICIVILLRWCVSMHSYSGQGKPPMFGDYEAQRHWMEVTYNLPLSDWYFNTTDNNLMYWGLDYPPLTAYHSFLCGFIATRVNPEFTALNSSHGYESYEHKLFMRTTVFAADLFVYIPSVWWYFSFRTSKMDSETNFKQCYIVYSKILTVYFTLAYPGIILIDYGHFQYNNISLGLMIAAVAALCRKFHLTASVLFCFALNYKQMELYHAMPFFCYLLGVCCMKKDGKFSIDFLRLLSIAFMVILSFLFLWLPFLKNLNLASQVILRLFPLGRGVFEDKVANIWCSVNVIYKLKKTLDNISMAKLCLLTTILAVLPSSIDLLIKPNMKKFVVALINSSLAFFLFSFQVHEKSILLAAIPVMLYFPIEPFICFWFLFVSVFSMLPLFIKDGLLLAFLALMSFYTISVYLVIGFKFTHSQIHDTKMGKYPRRGKLLRDKISAKENMSSLLLNQLLERTFAMSLAGCAALTLSIAVLSPPLRYPDLYPLLISMYSCAHFVCFFMYFNYRQLCY